MEVVAMEVAVTVGHPAFLLACAIDFLLNVWVAISPLTDRELLNLRVELEWLSFLHQVEHRSVFLSPHEAFDQVVRRLDRQRPSARVLQHKKYRGGKSPCRGRLRLRVRIAVGKCRRA